MLRFMLRRVAAHRTFSYIFAMDDDRLDLIWGVEGIAQFIGRTYRQTYHMLVQGYIPGRCVGQRWVADRRDLIAFFRSDGERLVSKSSEIPSSD